MFDFDVGKLIIVGIVALAVIPPKDLPRVMRAVGQALGKMRRMAAEFQGQFNEAMREADLDGVKRELDNVKKDLDGVKDGVKKEVESLEQSTKIDAAKIEAPKIEASKRDGAFDPAMAIHSELSHTIEPPKEVGLSEVALTASPRVAAEPEPVAVVAPAQVSAPVLEMETAPADAPPPRDAAE